MSTLRTLDELDHILGDACGCIAEAAANEAAVSPDGDKRFKRILADALVRVFDARDMIYASRPDLKSELLGEADADPAAARGYFAACSEARAMAAAGNPCGSRERMRDFVSTTSSACFRRLGERELKRYVDAL